MVADGYEVERHGLFYHTACDPNTVPAAATEGATLCLPRRTGYEGTTPKENAGGYVSPDEVATIQELLS
jgi:hypothetical protein